MKLPTLFIFSILFLNACAVHTSEPSLEQIVNRYLEVFKKRTDFDKFLSFYDENAQLEDMVYGHYAAGRAEIEKFYAWPQSRVTVLDNKPLFTIEQKVIDKQQRVAIVSGQFHRFEYGGENLGPWRFLIKLQFGEQGLITYQQDWINYTPKAMVNNGENLNILRR
ncbi:nuclear transport factor 2 family protein [Pseudoalteromonas byunsanensis]